MQNKTFSVAVKAALCKDSLYAFCLDCMELFQGEMTIMEWVTDAGKVYCKILHPCFLTIEGAALNKNAGIIALFN
jgi:hypothetical protein